MADARPDTKTSSVTWLKSTDESKPATPLMGRELELHRVEAEHAAREREIAERAERAARREREIAQRTAATKAAEQQRHQRPPVSRSGSNAPSFLGLSGGYDPEPAEEPADEYDRSDIYGGGRSYTRALLLLVLLLVVAGLAFLQWRYSSGLRASPPAETPATTQPADESAAQAAPETPEAKQGDAQAEKNQSGASSPPEQSKPDASEPASGDKEASAPPEEPRTGKMNPPAEPEQQAKVPNGAEQPGNKEVATADNTPKNPAETKSKPTARVRAKTPPPEVSDEPVRLAESYIYGRGLPQSCPQGVTILREAANRGNYKAQIKLGALYATGNCVSLDRVQAYRFLTRALQGKPGNTWVEQNRSMLWTQMNEQERREAMEQNF
ncbi:MAG: hypothetical protein L0Z53_12995 [Acidobacteriales bacterium]|nr:hypothetical protein [Terriglobales bacterium]